MIISDDINTIETSPIQVQQKESCNTQQQQQQSDEAEKQQKTDREQQPLMEIDRNNASMQNYVKRLKRFFEVLGHSNVRKKINKNIKIPKEATTYNYPSLATRFKELYIPNDLITVKKSYQQSFELNKPFTCKRKNIINIQPMEAKQINKQTK